MTGDNSPPPVVSRRSKDRVAYFDESLPAELIEELWQRPESLVASGQPLQTKPIRRTVLCQWRSQRYVVKQYVEPTWGHAFKHSFEHSRARRTWAATQKLAGAGIATPRAVACIENPWGQLRRDSFMMYPYVEGRGLRSYFENSSERAPFESYWEQLRELWQRLAELRVSLSDTNVRNFIVCPAGRVWVIDLDKTRSHWTDAMTSHYHRKSWTRLVRSVEKAQKQAA